MGVAGGRRTGSKSSCERWSINRESGNGAVSPINCVHSGWAAPRARGRGEAGVRSDAYVGSVCETGACRPRDVSEAAREVARAVAPRGRRRRGACLVVGAKADDGKRKHERRAAAAAAHRVSDGGQLARGAIESAHSVGGRGPDELLEAAHTRSGSAVVRGRARRLRRVCAWHDRPVQSRGVCRALCTCV
eukprot:2136365-Prymnesium_polylepis.1